MEYTDKDRERFWSKVDIRGQDDCWEWQASLNTHGYGQIIFKTKSYNAHRLSYILSTGTVPEGLVVCHRCNNRKCCNPSHLYAGTVAENMADRGPAGTSNMGMRYKAPKLTPQQRTDIVDAYRGGVATRAELARRYGVTAPAVSYLCSGARYNKLNSPKDKEECN